MSAIQFKTFDVRPILARGEEPREQIIARIGSLAPGHGLVVLAPFLPAPLIEGLKSEGYSTAAEHAVDGSWAVRFWRE